MLGLLLMVLPVVLMATLPSGHPMHTAVAEISYDAASRTASIQIRIFADDLYAAIPRNTPAKDVEVAISQYLEGKFELADPVGHALPWNWIGAERSGDVLLLRLTARVPEGLSRVRITSTVLCERFADQVNIVRASYGGYTSTLLFTRGDASKPLP